MMVSKPPPNRNTANPITITAKVMEEGFEEESLRNQRLSENDIDEACFLTFLDIFQFLLRSVYVKYSFHRIFKAFFQIARIPKFSRA